MKRVQLCSNLNILFGVALLWDWNENWPFPVLWPLMSFPNLLAYWVQPKALELFKLNGGFPGGVAIVVQSVSHAWSVATPWTTVHQASRSITLSQSLLKFVSIESVMLSNYLSGSVVKNLPVKQETQVWPLSQEDPLEKEMATHSSILTWEVPWTRGAWWAAVHEVARVRHDSRSKQEDTSTL